MLNSLALWAATSTAWGFGGSFAGPLGTAPPPSSGTQVAVATRGEQTTVTVTTQAAEDIEGFAFLWPAPGLLAKSVRLPELDGLLELEAFTRPRVERITCDELLDTVQYRTPPGCASYDVTELAPPPRGEDAVGEVAIQGDFAAGEPEVTVLTVAQLQGWLDDKKLGITADVRAQLDPLLVDGTPLLAVFHADTLPRGSWMRPIRFDVGPGDLVLPLAGWAAEASTAHELTLLTISDQVDANPTLLDAPVEGIEQDCRLSVTDAEDYWEEATARLRARLDLPFVPVHASSAASCAPCTSDLLSPAALADLGVSGSELSALRVGRLFVRYIPGQLTSDPVLSFSEPATDWSTTWIADEPGLGFAWPACEGELDPSDVCPTIDPPTSGGCSAAGAGSTAGFAALLGLMVLARRRRAERALWLACLISLATAAPTATAASVDRSPRLELAVSTGLVGTDRVVTSAVQRGAPHVGAPFLGLGARYALWGWRDGANVGVAANLRGWRGSAAPGTEVPLTFTLIEPSIAVDVRHGRWREGVVSPFFRYGVGAAFPWLKPNVSAPVSSVAGMLEVGVGGWIRLQPIEGLRPSVELRLSVLPRTDGFVTDYHPTLGFPQVIFFPGTANLQLRIGATLK
ncbi:MAG: DUF2330 domain-containing protein [Myxococcales bacterium]|nr:DUF2330 domain-containing protein [Myxococcales bacterium]